MSNNNTDQSSAVFSSETDDFSRNLVKAHNMLPFGKGKDGKKKGLGSTFGAFEPNGSQVPMAEIVSTGKYSKEEGGKPRMKNKLRDYVWPALFVIALLGFLRWHILHDAGEIAERTDAGGFVTFYDGDFGKIRRVRLDPGSTRVFRNPGGKYLLQSESADRSTSVYDVNGSRLKEVLLAGKHIATSNRNYMLIEKAIKKDKKALGRTYDYGLVLSETAEAVQKGIAEDTPGAKIIMWGQSSVAIYDEDEGEICGETFFGRDLRIEKVLPCTGSKAIVFSSEDEYPKEFGPDWEYYLVNQRISFSVIDYHQESKGFQPDSGDVRPEAVDDSEFDLEDMQWPVYCGAKLASVEAFSKMDVTSSQDGMFVAGAINDSNVFLINVQTEQTVFTKPLMRSINGNSDSKVLQIEASNGGAVHILMHYSGDKDFLVYENYNKTGNVTQMQVIEDMGDAARMGTDETEVTITDGTRKKTIKLIHEGNLV